MATSSIQRCGSHPLLDLSDASIQADPDHGHPAILLPNQSDDVPHLAVDIGGSLIKLVYFSRNQEMPFDDRRKDTKQKSDVSAGPTRSHPVSGGQLHFVKFETDKLKDCLEFITTNRLHCKGTGTPSLCNLSRQSSGHAKVIKATGGGAHKFADTFREKLGISLDKRDEMDCLVAGANFLLKAFPHEAFTHMKGQKEFVQMDSSDLFPYLLVNIGSGVSIIKVDGDGQFQRVSGTSLGGGTFWGLGRSITQCNSFDELLDLSKRGNTSNVDLLVGDIYGSDYSKIGLSASATASSFGKMISETKEFTREDASLSLLRMISYNIGQISYLNALLYGIKRIFFGGFFIRGHAYTMDVISAAIHYWSKGQMEAMFLRHDGFLGALGAFVSYEKHDLR